jgi:hypothetical protein
VPNRDTPAGTTPGGTTPSPGSTTPAPGGAPPVDSKNKLKIEIAKAKVSVNGTAVAIPAELAVFEKVFGKPSGTADAPLSDSNKYVFWSELGISCSQDKKGKQEVRQIKISLDPSWDLSAKAVGKPFTGDLIIEGQAITKALANNRAELTEKLNMGRDVFGSWQIEYADPQIHVAINPGGRGFASVTVSQPLVAR